MREEVLREQVGRRLYRLECGKPTENFAAIVARHPRGSDFCRPLVYVKICRMLYPGATVTQVHSAFGVMRKIREKFAAYSDELKGLLARAGDLAGNSDIMAVPEHSPKRVTGE
jgi:hypothetical protein